MTKHEFAVIITDFGNAFLEPMFAQKSVLETWFKYFEEFDERDFRVAVDDFILRQEKRPSLSELRSRVKKAKSTRENEERKREEENNKQSEEEWLETMKAMDNNNGDVRVQ